MTALVGLGSSFSYLTHIEMALRLTPATVRGLMPPVWPFSPAHFPGGEKCRRLQLFLSTCCCLHRCPPARIPDAARGRCGHAAVRWRPPPAEPSLPAAPRGALTPQRRLGSLRARTLQLCPPLRANTGGNSDEIRYPSGLCL